jgi:CRISPR system Cascade subunit CasB
MLRWLSPWTAALGPREARVCLQVAALFALHPATASTGNIGRTCAALAQRDGGSALETRFMRMLSARGEDLPRHLQRVVVLAREAGVPVNWAQLLSDMRHWDHPQRYVQMDWAHAFWSADLAPQKPTPQPLCEVDCEP